MILDELRQASRDALGGRYERLILDVLGITEPPLARWTAVYAEISGGLTERREEALASAPSGRWGGDDHLAVAALVFGQRTFLSLARIFGRYPLEAAALSDLGSGSGAASLAAAIHGVRVTTLVDASPAATTLGRAILERVGGVRVETATADLQTWRPRSSAVVLAKSLNEVFARRPALPPTAASDLIVEWVREGSPRVVVLEPGTHAASRRLQAVRDGLTDRARVLAPCTHALPCPMLPATRDWCHFSDPTPLGPIARELMLRGHRDPDDLPFSWLVVAPSSTESTPAQLSRVFGRRNLGKGKVGTQICDHHGIRSLVGLTRTDGGRALSALASGALVTVDDGGLQVRGDGLRVDGADTVSQVQEL